MRRSIMVFTFAAVLVACATSPLGRKQLSFFPDEQLDQMGVAAYAQAKQETPTSTDSVVNAYVNCVARAVTAEVQSGGPKAWEVTVFNKDDVNAFALPGGKIGVYTGLLKVAKGQDQLATVVSHEVAHVLAKHSNERVSTAYATQSGLQLVEAVAGGASQDKTNLMALLGLGAQVGVILPFSRTQESEADLLGLDLMARAGFDPRASVELWKNMAAAGGSGGPAFLSTHPASGTRIKDLENRMSKAMPIYQQARAQGKVPRCQ